jgi:hypothetical protein
MTRFINALSFLSSARYHLLRLMIVAFLAVGIIPFLAVDVHAQQVTQQAPHDQIYHDFSCGIGVYHEFIIPRYPGVLTINFLQVTTSDRFVTDQVYVNADPNQSGYFNWKLASTGQVQSGPVNSYYFGTLVTTYTDYGSGFTYYVASICNDWSSDGQEIDPTGPGAI